MLNPNAGPLTKAKYWKRRVPEFQNVCFFHPDMDHFARRKHFAVDWFAKKPIVTIKYFIHRTKAKRLFSPRTPP